MTDTVTELSKTYNRLQKANKIIAELVGLLDEHREADPDLNSDDYLDELSDRTADALDKYGDINGD